MTFPEKIPTTKDKLPLTNSASEVPAYWHYQASFRLHQGSLPRFEEEQQSVVCGVCPGQYRDGRKNATGPKATEDIAAAVRLKNGSMARDLQIRV